MMPANYWLSNMIFTWLDTLLFGKADFTQRFLFSMVAPWKNHMANLHYNVKTNMVAIEKKANSLLSLPQADQTF